MSIIYDALKKIGTNLENPNEGALQFKAEKKPNTNPYVISGFVLAIFLGFISANYLFKAITPKDTIPKKTAATIAVPIAAPEKTAEPADPEPAQPASTPFFSVLEQVVPATTPTDIDGPPFIINGIFHSKQEAYAIINNRVLRTGDIVEGAKVLDIQSDAVELKYEGAVIRLSPESR